MIRRYTFAFILLTCIRVQAASTPPTPAPFGAGPELDFRTFYKTDSSSLLGEAVQRWDTDNRHVQIYSLGGYYRLFKSLRVGAFYQRAYGLRHDDDWVNPGPGWGWTDTSGRGEDFLIADVSPRFMLTFLPGGENWVAEIKTRYLYNFFNQQQTLTLRPGLNYFWLRNDRAFMNLFLQYELYFPLNYGATTIYEQWLYVGALYQALAFAQMGCFLGYHSQVWGTSSSFLAKTDQSYLIQDTSMIYGLTLILQF